MINQAADPSATASSGREGGVGRRGCGGEPRTVAFRGREESRSRRRPAGRALATSSWGWAGRGLEPGGAGFSGQGAEVAAGQPGRTWQGTAGAGSAVS